MAPVEEALPALRAALSAGGSAVLVAPPGAGKTTRVPLALLDEPWAKAGRILLLEPRRLAARAAARFMASTLGEPVGRTVGLRVRFESHVTAATRLEVLTEGVFTRRILSDPGLAGVAAVIFDEIHERSLESDLGLALALDARAGLRPDLKLLAMSATLDAARVAELLDGPVIASRGRAYEVETRYLGSDARTPLETRMAQAIRRALAEERGSVLAFLPGQAEIRRTAERLAESVNDPGLLIRPLFGAMEARAQDEAIAPAAPGTRKVVLATSIAETSLTIEGVRVVVDSGLSRRARFTAGAARLETRRASRASVDQRRGRAGRTGPGVCYRLWEEAETRALIAFNPPELLEADLAGLVLDLADWGAPADRLAWLDPPPRAALEAARQTLRALGAIDEEGRITARGRQLADLPLAPHLAGLVLTGAEQGEAGLAAELAALLSEPTLGGRGVDMRTRLAALRRDMSPRGRAAREAARGWARLAERGRPPAALPLAAAGGGGSGDNAIARLLALAYPDGIALARPGQRGEYLLASGMGARLPPEDPLAGEACLIVADAMGAGASARVTAAAPLARAELEGLLSHRIETIETAGLDPASGRLRARAVRRLGALVLEETPIAHAGGEAAAAAFLAHVRQAGLPALPWSACARGLQARAVFMAKLDGGAWPDLSDDALIATLEDWLGAHLAGVESLHAIPLERALGSALGWERQRRLDTDAPERFTTPAGASHAIDYAAQAGPMVAARAQEFYGLSAHPTIAGGRVRLVLALLSPAQRPIAVTTDLAGFWRTGWADARKDMRGRYPKHDWPEDPASAAPTLRAKRKPPS